MFFQGYCLIRCHTNQNSFLQTCIAKHESNGIDIIIALIVNPINPLGKHRLDLVLQLKVSSRCLELFPEGHLLWLAAVVAESRPSLQFLMLRTRVNIFFQIRNIWVRKNDMFCGLNEPIILEGQSVDPPIQDVVSVCWIKSSTAGLIVKLNA